MVQVSYATVEDVISLPEVTFSAYAKHEIISKLESASRSVESFTHRRFYPEQRTIKLDWPNYSYGPTWEIDLGDNEMISLTQVLSGGVDITSGMLLTRRDGKLEPPYNVLQADLSSAYSFRSGNTFQQALIVSGLFSGDRDTDTTIAGATLSGGINTSVATLVLNPVSGYYTPGIGSLVLIDSERLILMDRRMSAVSGQTLSGTIAAQQNATTVGVTSGTAFAAREVILVDGERMKINDIAGNNLIVERAYDGTLLATHSSGTAVYAQRTFLAARGALGSTAASHSDAANVYVHAFPGLINELTTATALVGLQQMAGAYMHNASARTTANGGTRADRLAQRETPGLGIDDLRDRVWAAHARKGRKGAI